VSAQYDNTDGRLRGRQGVARRLRLWSKDPKCAMCRRLTDYPGGFHIDHKIALINGGTDTEDNLQVLCIGPEGCHAKKTAQDLGHRVTRRIGVDGWPE
jgi:5-methylcytosine-specific restriction protein A